jgi:dTDP-4-dehydrorhamnose reductase
MLIIGSRGFVGAHLEREAIQVGYDVIRGERTGTEDKRTAAVDVANPPTVDAALDRFRPQVVVLLAALSDIDRCEAEPQLAWAVNVEGAANVASACAASGARLLFTSSGAVFDGMRHGYSEGDPPTPVSVYGRTKAEAELQVAANAPGAVIVRFGLVIGFAGRPGTNSMLDNVADRWARDIAVAFPTFEYRNPIDVATLCRFMLKLIDAAPDGLYHIGSSEAISRYELGLRVARRMAYPSRLVQPQATPALGRAPRGLHHFLLTDKIQSVCSTPIPSCDEVIERCFHGSAQGSF